MSKIDVIIPTYNAAKYVEMTLQSVVNQTFKPHQIIIVDDKSQDNTVAVVQKFQETSTIPIKLILQEINQGVSKARNRALLEATSEYVAFVDADDLWHESKLEMQMRVFEASEFKDVGVVYNQYEQIDEQGVLTNKYFKLDLNFDVKGKIFSKLLPANIITGSASAVIVKKEYLDKVGYFDEDLANCEDWDLWLRLSEVCSYDYVPMPLSLIRRHGNNSQNNKEKMFRHQIKFYKKWLVKLPREQIPKLWSHALAGMVIGELPDRSLLKILREKDNNELRTIIFKRFGGFFSLYLTANMAIFTLNWLKSFYQTPKYVLTKLISGLLPLP